MHETCYVNPERIFLICKMNTLYTFRKLVIFQLKFK